MRKAMIGTGMAIAALFGVATSSIAATVRAGDSLPTASKRAPVRAGTAAPQDGEEAGVGLTTTEYVVGGLALLAVVGGVIVITQSESP